MNATWKCTVCGYLYKGEQPPETCPVCRADREKFSPLTAEPGSDAGAPLSGATPFVAGIDSNWSQIIVAQAPDAILVADTNGLIRLWNHGAERIFGVAASEALGQSLDLIIPENLRQRHWQGWGKVMQTGTSRYGEEQLLRVPAIRGDGSRISAEFSIIMLKDALGTISGIAAILRDVTPQWERENRLQQQLKACQEQGFSPTD